LVLPATHFPACVSLQPAYRPTGDVQSPDPGVSGPRTYRLTAEPRQELHYAYQQSSILSYAPYRIGALPDERQLVSDLRELVPLYTEIVSDPLEATVDRLVEAVVDQAPALQTPEVHDFQSPRRRSNMRVKNCRAESVATHQSLAKSVMLVNKQRWLTKKTG
jgi:hypothetical protein